MDKDSSKSVVEKTQTVTINIEMFLTPIAIILSALLVSGTLLFSLNNVANAVKVGGTGTATTGTTTTTTGVTVTLDQIKSLNNLENGIKFGDANAKVTFVEFSDPSCPYCHIAGGKNPALNTSAGFVLVEDGGSYVAPVPEFKKLVDEGKAAYIWFYTNGHGNGEMGTKAMYCAYEQGKFWEMHDYLYSEDGYTLLNDNIKNDKTKSGAMVEAMKNKVSGVNLDQIKSCLDSGKYDGRIAEDQAKGTELGVQGTPGFFVNEKNYAGAYSYTDMKPTVDAFLNN